MFVLCAIRAEENLLLTVMPFNDCLAQVEKTPAVIKTGLKKEEAEALKAKLEAGMSSWFVLVLPFLITCQHIMRAVQLAARSA